MEMKNSDWENFERFGANESGIFFPLTESNILMGKYKTERRDKRAIRVAAYAPAVGMAIGAAHGYSAADKYRDQVGKVTARNKQKLADRKSGVIGKISHATTTAGRTIKNAPGRIINKARNAAADVIRGKKPNVTDSKRVKIPKGSTYDALGDISKHSKNLMGKIDKYGTKKLGSKAAYDIMKRHTKAGLIAGAAFVPIHSLARLHQKNKARREEIGKRENF